MALEVALGVVVALSSSELSVQAQRLADLVVAICLTHSSDMPDVTFASQSSLYSLQRFRKKRELSVSMVAFGKKMPYRLLTVD